jgi:serine protease Do
VSFGDSDKVQVGDLVLAIGDPFGVGQTVTMGIVSAQARTQSLSSDAVYIQTDAAINPGNSGGALVTTDGRLVGINSSIYSNSGGNIGIGFASPSNLAKRFVEGAGSGGTFTMAWFGGEGQPVTAAIAATFGLPRPEGVILKNIYPDSPAAKAGLKVGDVVLAIDGYPVDDMQSLNYRVTTHKPGDGPSFKISSDGRVRDVRVVLAAPPEIPRGTTVIGGRSPLTGAKVENLSPAVALDLNMDEAATGVVITEIAQGTPAAGYGFQPGDIVRGLNGKEIKSVSELTATLAAAQGHWQIVVDRGGSRLSLSIDG